VCDAVCVAAIGSTFLRDIDKLLLLLHYRSSRMATTSSTLSTSVNEREKDVVLGSYIFLPSIHTTRLELRRRSFCGPRFSWMEDNHHAI